MDITDKKFLGRGNNATTYIIQYNGHPAVLKEIDVGKGPFKIPPEVYYLIFNIV